MQAGRAHGTYFVMRLVAALAAAALVGMFSFAGFQGYFDRGAADTGGLVPDYGEGMLIGDWWFVEKRSAGDNEWVLSFVDVDGSPVYMRFSGYDPVMAADIKTKYFNIDVSGGAHGDRAAEKVLEDVRSLEERAPERGPVAGRRRLVCLQGVLFFLLAALLFDLSLTGVRFRSSAPEAKYDPASKRFADALFGLFFILITINILRDLPWEYAVSVDFFSVPGRIGGPGEFLAYILGDPGLPSVTYRALMALMACARDFMLVRWVIVAMGGLVAFVTYRLAARHVSPVLSWAAPAAMMIGGAFSYGMSDTRGYMFFTLFGLVGIVLFGAAAGRPSPWTLFAWVVCNAVAFMSNPLTIVLSAGPFYYYVFGLRRGLGIREKKLIDIHFAFLFGGFAMFAPFVMRAVGTHGEMFGGAAYAPPPVWHANTIVMLALSFVFALAALRHVRDFRSALFGSASAGMLAVLAMFQAGVLLSRDHYFLYVMPLVVVCCALIAEEAIGYFGRRRPRVAGRVALAVALVFGAWVLFTQAKELAAPGDYESIKNSHAAADSFIKKHARPGEAVYVYPLEPYMWYLDHKFNLDVFNRNFALGQVPELQLKFRNFDSGNVVLDLGGYYTSYPGIEPPGAVFEGGFVMMLYDGAGGGALFEDGVRCDASQSLPGLGFSIRRCISSKSE